MKPLKVEISVKIRERMWLITRGQVSVEIEEEIKFEVTAPVWRQTVRRLYHNVKMPIIIKKINRKKQ